jgi:hypothetical protein
LKKQNSDHIQKLNKNLLEESDTEDDEKKQE